MVFRVTVMSVEVTEPPDPFDSPDPAAPPAPVPRRAERLAVLGDSTAVGLGDPLPGGGWRGVGPLLADALGVDAAGYLNTSFEGARMRCVRTEQLPAALGHRPDVAVLVVGMNDTLRPDFDARDIAANLTTVITELAAVGTTVVPVKFHDHGKVFRLPAALRRALSARIAELNAVVEEVVTRLGVPCLELGELPGAYELTTWSVDRLHPSEYGHRLLARGFADALAGTGFAVPEPVSMTCSGGAEHGTVEHVGWLVLKGIPWLWRRGRDFLPYAATIMWREFRDRYGPRPSRGPNTVSASTSDAGCRTNPPAQSSIPG
ncbi:SGNH/GDSL hydrolase family protein [Amycolatopsis sp. H20-H5]|uniref:SGNH/GDSL hydrolase family protein n=1 Tax=Amycolatopsis sp. H20-H5 TaxID=3046309 RepID=UPI002DC01849|nr:SGNH/GDSL hydrolase family protein [Amycolatopsis sp. H20-H5]MEC3981634.1 SGNH/GDSL hydrolase family protein [Amycolatopsis sp. H20-H5]